jgi:hypothetical protein
MSDIADNDQQGDSGNLVAYPTPPSVCRFATPAKRSKKQQYHNCETLSDLRKNILQSLINFVASQKGDFWVC